MCDNTNDTPNKKKASEGHAWPKKQHSEKKLLVCVGGRVFGINDIFKDGKK